MNMWELNKSQAKEFELKYLQNYFESINYKLRKTQSSIYNFNKKNKENKDILLIGHLETFPGTRIEFVVMKEIFSIEQHLKTIKLGLGESVTKRDHYATIKFNQTILENVNSYTNYMPEMFNEADVAASCEIIKNFMTETGFPILERFNDIKELDKEINDENFWTTDWQMPFNLGGDFDIKRIIIAKLAQNSKLDTIINHHLRSFDELIATGEYVELRKEAKMQFETAVKYLQNL